MQPQQSQTEKNASDILRCLRQYLDLRFSHASRLNPKFRQVEADLKWHELNSVGKVLRKSKPFGENRYAVADILVSFDMDKRRALYNPKHQSQIMNEIVVVMDEKDQVKTGLLHIRDLRSLYNAIDPFLMSIIELIQTWIWWDLQDAADLTHFDHQIERFQMLLGQPLRDEVALHYRNEMKRQPTQELELQDILDFEYYRTEELVQQLIRRMEYQPDYQEIIAREATEDRQIESQIMQLAQHVRAIESLRNPADLDPSLRDYYSKVLRCAPEEVSREQATDFENRYMIQARQALLEALQVGGATGAPYDFKASQLENAKARLAQVRAAVNPRPPAPVEPPKTEE